MKLNFNSNIILKYCLVHCCMEPSHTIIHPNHNPPPPSLRQKPHHALSSFANLSQLITKYAQLCLHIDQKATVSQLGDQMRQLTSICGQLMSLLEQMSLSTHLAEQQLLACLQQSLQMILKYQKVEQINQERNKKQQQYYKMEYQYIHQVQSSLTHKIANIIVKYTFPQRINSKNLIQCIKVIVDNLMELNGRVVVRKSKGRGEITYDLLSGKKISLLCYLLTRLFQKELQVPRDTFIRQNQKKSLQLDIQSNKHILSLLKEGISFIIHEYKDLQLPKQFLQAIISHLYEFQLPILPLLAQTFHLALIHNFTNHYRLHLPFQLKNTHQQIYSLECLLLLLSASQHMAILSRVSIEKEILHQGIMICCYCGVDRQVEFRREGEAVSQEYFKVRFRVNDKSTLVMRICKNCSSQLVNQKCEQIDSQKWMLLAPLIYSKISHSPPHSQPLKTALQRLLKFHITSNNLSSPHPSQIDIKSNIAMNSDDQKVSSLVIENAYKAFIVTHRHLDMPKMIMQLFRVITIYANSDDGKLREKALKSLLKSKILDYLRLGSDAVSVVVKQEITRTVSQVIRQRLLDQDTEVRIAALQALSQLYNSLTLSQNQQEYFLQLIFKQISTTEKSQFIKKAIIFIQKILQTNTSEKKQAKEYSYSDQDDKPGHNVRLNVTMWVKMMKLCITLINRSQKNNDTPTSNDNHCSGLLHHLITLIQSNYIPPHQQLHISSSLNLTIIPPLSILQNIIVYLFGCLNMHFMQTQNSKLVSYVDRSIVVAIIDQFHQYSDHTFLRANMINFIATIYREIEQFREDISSVKKLPIHFKFKRIESFLHTPQFISYLIKEHKLAHQPKSSKSNSQIVTSFKIEIIQNILHYQNLYYIANDKKEQLAFLNYHHQQKSKSKPRKSGGFPQYQKMVLGVEYYIQLLNLAQSWHSELKECGISQILSKGSAYVSSMLYLNKIQDINRCVSTYLTYIPITRKKIQTYSSQPDNKDHTLTLYNVIVRCFCIVTILITQLQRYIYFNHQINQYVVRQTPNQFIGSTTLSSSQSNPIEPTSTIFASDLFHQSYHFLLSFLEQQILSSPLSSQLQNIHIISFNLLQHYWQLYPELIITSNPLIVKISSDFTSVEIIRNMYALFKKILPCKNLRVLSLINHSLSATFHKLIKIDHSSLTIQDGFTLIYHMLKGGMTSLCDFNRYVFFGLLCPSKKVNQMVVKIIKQIYQLQSSEKMLFTNLSQSFNHLYEYLPPKDYFYMMTFSDYQLKNLQLLHPTIHNKKPHLIKQKYQLKISSTLIKKIGELLSTDSQMLKCKPIYLFLIIQFVRNQKVMDYSELTEIIFSIQRVVTMHYPFIESLKQKREDGYDENMKRNLINIVGVFRETVHLLTILTNYQPVQQAIKRYHKSMQLSSNPYMTLKPQIQLRVINWDQDNHQNIIKELLQDIDLFLQIIMGVTQLKLEAHDEEQQQDLDENTSLTDKTKLKRIKANKDKKYKSNPVPQNKRTKMRKDYHSEAYISQQESQELQSNNLYKDRLRKRQSKMKMQC